MAKSKTFTGRLDKVVKCGCSYYGNPHFWVILVSEDGETLYGKTEVNGSIGYGLRNGGEGKYAKVQTWEYHETRTGNIIITNVR